MRKKHACDLRVYINRKSADTIAMGPFTEAFCRCDRTINIADHQSAPSSDSSAIEMQYVCRATEEISFNMRQYEFINDRRAKEAKNHTSEVAESVVFDVAVEIRNANDNINNHIDAGAAQVGDKIDDAVADVRINTISSIKKTERKVISKVRENVAAASKQVIEATGDQMKKGFEGVVNHNIMLHQMAACNANAHASQHRKAIASCVVPTLNTLVSVTSSLHSSSISNHRDNSENHRSLTVATSLGLATINKSLRNKSQQHSSEHANMVSLMTTMQQQQLAIQQQQSAMHHQQSNHQSAFDSFMKKTTTLCRAQSAADRSIAVQSQKVATQALMQLQDERDANASLSNQLTNQLHKRIDELTITDVEKDLEIQKMSRTIDVLRTEALKTYPEGYLLSISSSARHLPNAMIVQSYDTFSPSFDLRSSLRYVLGRRTMIRQDAVQSEFTGAGHKKLLAEVSTSGFEIFERLGQQYGIPQLKTKAKIVELLHAAIASADNVTKMRALGFDIQLPAEIEPAKELYLKTLAPYYGVNMGKRELEIISAWSCGALAILLFRPTADIVEGRACSLEDVSKRPSATFIHRSAQAVGKLETPVCLLIIHEMNIMPFHGTHMAQKYITRRQANANYIQETHMARVSLYNAKSKCDLIPVALLIKLYGWVNWRINIEHEAAVTIHKARALWMPFLKQRLPKEIAIKIRVDERTRDMKNRTLKQQQAVRDVKQTIKNECERGLMLPLSWPFSFIDPINSSFSPRVNNAVLPSHGMQLTTILCNQLIGASPHQWDTPTQATAKQLIIASEKSGKLADSVYELSQAVTPHILSGDYQFDIDRGGNLEEDEPELFAFDHNAYFYDRERELIHQHLNPIDNDKEMMKYWKKV